MRYQRTTGLMLSQMQELVRRVNAALVNTWHKDVGRGRSFGLYKAVETTCMYIRHNSPQEYLGDLLGASQPTVSRVITTLTPLIKSVLEECVPTAEDAIDVVNGQVCLVDGTITPCWSYAKHPQLWSRKHGTTGFNAQLVSLLDGDPVYIAEPLAGSTHDATAMASTPVAEIINNSGGAIADKGYQGCPNVITPRKTPPGGELSKTDKQDNKVISALRAPIEHVVAHFKSWRIFNDDYRRPHDTYNESYDAGCGLFFFSITWGFE